MSTWACKKVKYMPTPFNFKKNDGNASEKGDDWYPFNAKCFLIFMISYACKASRFLPIPFEFIYF